MKKISKEKKKKLRKIQSKSRKLNLKTGQHQRKT